MKVISLIITAVFVILYNLIAQKVSLGDGSNRMVVSGIIAIIVYELSYLIVKLLNKK